jgi:hypothetical protein
VTFTAVSISAHFCVGTPADCLTSHRLCKNVFDHDYKATIGVDFEIERFEIAGIPYSLQM